jgi:hypothetical protein
LEALWDKDVSTANKEPISSKKAQLNEAVGVN